MAERLIKWADSTNDYQGAAALIMDYSARFGQLICFEGLSKEVSDLRTFYPPELGGVIVCIEDHRVIGCCAILGEQNEHGEKGSAEFRRNFVMPEYRKTGIAKSMLKFAIQAAKDLGFQRVWLETHESMKEAIALYQSFDFKEIKRYTEDEATYIQYEKVW